MLRVRGAEGRGAWPRRCGRYRPQPQAPPQQPPPAGWLPAALALPPTEIVESSRTVSSWPCGHGQGADDSLIGRDRSKVSPQARQRYSYRGTGQV